MTFSGSRFGGWYFLAQAVGIAAWWIYLSAEPSAVPLFPPRGAAEGDLRAFQMPDLLVAVPVSLAASASIFISLRWAMPLAWFAAGAMVYAFWEYLVRPAEERDLRDAFGDEFETYSQHVRCWIPRTSAFRRVST